MKYQTIIKNKTLDKYTNRKKKECNCRGYDEDHAEDCPVNE
jgi:hypothetical protein